MKKDWHEKYIEERAKFHGVAPEQIVSFLAEFDIAVGVEPTIVAPKKKKKKKEKAPTKEGLFNAIIRILKGE